MKDAPEWVQSLAASFDLGLHPAPFDLVVALVVAAVVAV